MLRRIQSQEEMERKSERNKKIIVIFLGIIMLMSTAGYFVSEMLSGIGNNGSSKKVNYKGIEFRQNDYGYWEFSYGGNSYAVLFNPYDTENISSNSGRDITNYYNEKFYLSSEPIEEFPQTAGDEITKNLWNNAQKIDMACIDNCSLDYAIKNCSIDKVIVFKASQTNLTRIYDNENCIIIDYNEGDSEKASDALLFELLGINN